MSLWKKSSRPVNRSSDPEQRRRAKPGSSAYFGGEGLWYSEQRLAGFQKRAAQAGIECEVFLQPANEKADKTWPQRLSAVAGWLESLPRPVGIFAVHDYRAQFLMEVGHEAGFRVPEDIAVPGMDNDETICEHCVPTLSSISRSSERVGWEAAALLDRWMHGEPPARGDLFIGPDQVVMRQSTDRLYSGDPLVQKALDFMRANLKAQFNIAQLADRIGVSKRTLETRFRENLRSSPHDFLSKLRIQHAQALMRISPKRALEEMALECGFGSVRALNKLFHRVIGESPAGYRKRQHSPGRE